MNSYKITYGETSYDIFDWFAIYNAIILNTSNVIKSPINKILCLKIIGNTTILFPFNKMINYVAVGGGQSGFKNGGYGGGYVYGSIVASVPLTITIGAGGANTSITGTSISITALAGSSTGNGYTNQSGNTISINGGGRGGAGGSQSSYSSQDGSSGTNGYYISSLGIYVCGGGGGGAGGGGGYGGNAIGGYGGNGGGSAGGSNGPGTSGIANTGGGGGGSVYQNGGAAGGSGVVYLFI